MKGGVFTENREITGMLENIHLLRKLFIIRTSGDSPIHFGQIAIMKTIEQYENCTQADIAERLGVSAASVATSTKRLQKAGLITKTVDQDNQRCKRLALTDKGREAIEKRISLFEEYDRLIFGEFSDDDKLTLLRLLSRLALKMQQVEGIEENFSTPLELCHELRARLYGDNNER